MQCKLEYALFALSTEQPILYTMALRFHCRPVSPNTIRIAVGLLLSILVTTGTKAQYGNVTEKELQSILEDLANHDKQVPVSEFVLSSERSWTETKLALVRSVTQGESPTPEYRKEFETLKKELASLVNAMNSMECEPDRLEEGRSLLLSVENSLNFSDLYGVDTLSQEWEQLVSANPAYFGRSRSTSPTTADCAKLRDYMKSRSWQSLANAVIGVMDSELKGYIQEEESLRRKAKEVEERLKEYVVKLNGSAEKKAGISNNLPILLIIIGSLSLLAIGLVRLFPEQVMREWVTSGQVIQFVTVMILLSAIMALGLSDIIQENTLGTLLGGIAGYVLSQGVGKVINNAVVNPPPR